MAARSIASLTLSFGLVNIPVKLYSATESSSTIRFNLLAKDGSRLKQQYVSEKTGKVVERSEMVKGYEFEKDHFVLFSPEELKALDEGASHVIDIVAFVPQQTVDPIFYDKAYLLAPDKRGGKPYALLQEAMRKSGRCALARWSWKSKQYVVQVRAVEDGLVLQQLLYAEEVRSLKDLDIEHVSVSEPELKLALQLIDQIAQDTFDPEQFHDEEKGRILAAIDEKIAGKQVVATAPREEAAGGGAQVIDLMEALRASLGGSGRATGAARASEGAASSGAGRKSAAPSAAGRKSAASGASGKAAAAAAAEAEEPVAIGSRKSARRATPKPVEEEAAAAPARARARK